MFKYYDDNGERVDLGSADLNAYIRVIMGEVYSAKDFRSRAGRVLAARVLGELVLDDDDKISQVHSHIVVDRVVALLGNTPSIARVSYIDPRVIENYPGGRTPSTSTR